jgi:AAA15 family ATPase/GTPase
MISRITFENFRGFQCLDLQNLSRVNLVVGKNNAGKTSFLEGITLVYAPEKIVDMPRLFRVQAGSDETRYFSWLKNKNGKESKISLYLGNDAPLLSLGISSKENTTYFEFVNEDEMLENDEFCVINNGRRSVGLSIGNRFYYIKYPEQFNKLLIDEHKEMINADEFISFINNSEFSLDMSDLLLSLISTEHYPHDFVVGQFGKAIRQKNGEEQIESILKKIDPRIRKIRVDPAEDGNQIVVDIGLDEMIPLTQAGQGIYRLVTILSELIGEKPQVCLIDEIENGIHHTSLKTLWAGIAEIAEQLDIQIFATTHSHECIEAAHEVYSERENYDFSIVQLFRLESEIQGRVLDKEDIEVAVESDIELR